MICFKSHNECSGTIAGTSGGNLPNSEYTDRNDLGEFTEDQVSPHLLASLASDDEIRDILSSPSLQLLLRKLNGSRDRRRMFSKLYETGSSEFRTLIDAVAARMDPPTTV